MSAPTHADRSETSPPAVAPSPARAAAIDPEKLEVAPGRVREGIEGWIPVLATDDELRDALEKAFDYRGDVTITLKNNASTATAAGQKIEGYIFDRTTGPSLATSFIRILLKDSHQRVKIPYADIAALAFSGRDTAAGKSWDAWVRKYWEKKATGSADLTLQPESLD
ncbi:MAG: hypothetical protein NVS9B4_24960 [Candidatus Acidiferrum sp.]